MVFYCLNTQGAHSAVTSYRIRSETLVGLVFCNRWSFCFRCYHMLNKRAMALYTCVEKGNKSATGFCSLRTASESWQNIWIPSSTCIVMCIFLIWHGLFWQPPNSLGGQILPHIWNQWPNYLLIHVHIAYMVCDSLRGQYSLQTDSEVKFALRFEISDFNYLLIHVHIVDMVWSLLAASEATTASKQPQR